MSISPAVPARLLEGVMLKYKLVGLVVDKWKSRDGGEERGVERRKALQKVRSECSHGMQLRL